MFMIAEGAVEVTVRQGGGSLRVATLSSGNFFGELCLLTGEARSATVSALTTGLCFELRREAVAAQLQAHPELAEALEQALEQRLSHTSRQRDAHERATAVSEAQRHELFQRLSRLFRLNL